MSIYIGTFDSCRLDDDGPDGIYLVISTADTEVRVRVFDDDAEKFDAALQPLRDYRAEYAREKAAYDAATPEERERVLGVDVLDEDYGYELDDPKHPTYYERMVG